MVKYKDMADMDFMLIDRIFPKFDLHSTGRHGSRLVSFLNPYSYLFLRKRQDLYDEIDEFYCDGILLSRLMVLAGKSCKRISFDMTSLAPEVLKGAERLGRSVYFIGGEPGVVDQAVRVFRSEYDGLIVSGCRHGFFDNGEVRRRVIKDLVMLNPDFVVVGMGVPLQEKFIVDLKREGWSGVAFTCGGFFHQTAGKGTRYYPDWMNRLNLRWLYRMIDEPKLVRRYFVEYPRFLFAFFYDLMCYYLSKWRKRKNLEK
jgi:N-acetylglucosaminyldiphosphoundecaprenol N-acetyl-beta-D-mannosaminyltransferase